MNAPPTGIDPFRHLEPGLWIASKRAHITLFTIGSLLVAPALYPFVVLAVVSASGYGFGPSDLDTEGGLMLISFALSSCAGILAWTALGILFFKRADARWQRACWRVTAVFGWISTACTIGWLIFALNELFPHSNYGWPEFTAIAILLLVLGTSMASAVCGHRFSRSASAYLAGCSNATDR